MKIQTQNQMMILPLFVGLGLVSGGLMYTVEKTELEWGIREEARAVAVASTDFLSDKPTSDGSDQEGYDRLNRLVTRGRARRILMYTADGAKVVFDTERDNQDVQALSPEIVDAVGNHSVFIAPIEVRAAKSPDEKPTATEAIYSAITEPEGKGARRAVLATFIEVPDYPIRMNGLLVRVFTLWAVISAIGFIVSQWLSQRISREVLALREEASRMADGDLTLAKTSKASLAVANSRIQEVGDLANTMRTMRDVLNETLIKARRSLLESEQFRTDADLARTFGETFLPRIAGSLGPVEMIAAPVPDGRPRGDNEPARFYGATSAREGRLARAFFGTVRADTKESGPLETTLTASAVAALLTEELAHRDPMTAFAHTCDLFTVEMLTVVECQQMGAEYSAVEYIFDINDQRPSGDQLGLAPNEPLILLSGEGLGELRSRLAAYARLFGTLSPEELWSDLRQMLPPDVNVGSLFVVAVPVSGNTTTLLEKETSANG